MVLGIIFISIKNTNKESKQGLYYLISWIPLILGILSKIIIVLGYSALNIYSEVAIFLGVFLHFLCMMFLVLIRVKSVNDERINIQLELADNIKEKAELSKIFRIFVPTIILEKFINQKTVHIDLEKNRAKFYHFNFF